MEIHCGHRTLGRRVPWRAIATVAASLLFIMTARAQTASGGLTDPRLLDQFNALERAAAFANQATYDSLLDECGGPVLLPSCTSEVFGVFAEAQGLVHTANEILGSGSTQFSLGLDETGLGFALRWTAAEEIAAQGSSTTEFAASQLGSLAARLRSLRWGISGPRTTHNVTSPDGEMRVAHRSEPFAVGGAASADGIGKRWSGFLDASYGYGDKDPTDLEDAFDFDGQELTMGLDYRISDALVAGGMFGYSSKEVDFDSTQSVVDGGIKSDGYSALFYGLWEGDRAFLSGAIGYQMVSHDSRRRITYPSQNPLSPPANSLATSTTDSGALLASLGTGYAFRSGGFSVEPGLDLAYTSASVDAFTERSIDLSTNSPDDPFDLRIGSQSIDSLDAALGLKFDYVFTPGFGVLVPYLAARYHRELLNDTRRISARYAGAFELLLQDVANDSNFNVPTDEPDDDYYTVSAGASVVLQGGLMGFLQYMQVLGLDNYSDTVITGGIRYEFQP